MKYLKTAFLGLFTVFIGCGRSASPDNETLMKWDGKTFYSLSADLLTGEKVNFSEYESKLILVVNVASKCGFTGQYKGLQDIYKKYNDRGLVVLGFPSNEFGGQEPGNSKEIESFCSKNYGVTFPVFSKIQTATGDGQSAVYDFLGTKTGKLPGWNFCKYLIERDGQTVTFFSSMTSPNSDSFLSLLEKKLN